MLSRQAILIIGAAVVLSLAGQVKEVRAAIVTIAGMPYTFVEIDGPGSTTTAVTGINNFGDMTGDYSDSAGIVHGFLISGGVFTSFDYPGALQTEPAGISDPDTIPVRTLFTSGDRPSYLYIGGGSFLGPITVPGALRVDVTGISPNGQDVVGGYAAHSPSFIDTGFVRIGGIVSGGALSSISVAGASYTEAFGVNDAGTVVGYYVAGGVTNKAFQWQGGTLTDINPPDTQSTAFGINNNGQIVGSLLTQGKGYLASGGTFSPISVPVPNIYTEPVGINDSGQIVGNFFDGARVHGFLLTPLGKNLGTECNDNASDSAPDATCGNPINAAVGNKFQAETDFTGAPSTGLALTRYYNSQDTTNSGFGTGWHSTWHRSLNPISAGMVSVARADGRADTFSLSGGAWQADPDVTSRLTALVNGWQLVTADDTTETYSLAGQLMAVTTRAGLTTTLRYSANGQPTTVTGPFGHRLSFAYDAAGRVNQMTTPDGETYFYGYDVNNNLVSVTHPAGSIRQYVYGNASFPHALTGIIDENGNAYASWAYDAQGRAISSQHAGGADLTSVAYNADGSSSVTDADGNTHSYSLLTQFNMVKPTALSGAPYPPAGGSAFSYDSNGFLASRTDYDGNITTYTHDTRGNQTSRTEAAGTALARTITTAWHPTFHLPTSITEPGRVTSFSYDANGNLLRKTITAGSLTRSWAYTYNGKGQVLTATDPRGNVTGYTYYGTGDLATTTDALGHVTTLASYDADGRLLSMTDPNGLVTNLTYNFRGEPTSRNVGGEVTAYAYDAAGQLVKTTRPDGSFLVYTYDAAHRLTGIKDAVGDRVAFTLDPASNVTAKRVFDPGSTLAQTRSYTYDAVNRVAQAIGALGQTTAYAYDPNSNLTGVIDPLSHVTAYSYDVLNRRAQAIDAKGGATDYGYDALDHLTGVTDPRDLTTSYAWDGLDDQTAVTSPDSGATARTFDAAGNVISSTDARGLTTAYRYDALNRQIQATYADGRVVIWQYDQGTNGIGHLTLMSDLSGHTSWTYDQHGRVLAKHQYTAKMTLNTLMSYDAAGRLASITYPSGAAITLSYDAAGRVSGLGSGGTVLVSGVTYLPFGPAEGWTQGNGAVYSRSFDQDGRIAGIGLGSGTIALAYDAASRITGITETGLPAKGFGYDALDRLTLYTSGATTLTYGYDANGNRTNLGAGLTVLSYSIDPGSNRLLGSTGAGTRSLSYDSAGNVTVDSQPLTIFGYSYDASGRLVTAKTGGYTTSYTNDGSGERVTRSGYGASLLPGGNERFVYDQAGHLLGEYDGKGNTVQETVWLGDLPAAVLMPGIPPLYVAPDHLGSPHQIANAVGNTVWLWDHDPFGNGAPSGSLTYNLRFPGQYYDQETGLHYNGRRDYDPSTGRYVQSDPIGLRSGVNTYAYVGNNPVNRLDPTGLLPLGLPGGGPPLAVAYPPGNSRKYCGTDEENQKYVVDLTEDIIEVILNNISDIICLYSGECEVLLGTNPFYPSPSIIPGAEVKILEASGRWPKS